MLNIVFKIRPFSSHTRGRSLLIHPIRDDPGHDPETNSLSKGPSEEQRWDGAGIYDVLSYQG